jgi:hypothetical protein
MGSGINTSSSAYTPKDGDTFKLTRTLGSDTQTTTGTVSGVSGGNLTLLSGSTTFNIEVTGAAITGTIPADIPITGGGTMTPPDGVLTPSTPSSLPPLFTNQQVHVYDMSGNFVPLTTGSYTVTSNVGGSGSITNGRFNFNIGAPNANALLPIAGLLSLIDDIGLTFTPSDTSAQGAVLLFQVQGGYDLHYIKEDGANFSENFSEEFISLIYIDRDCTVGIEAVTDGDTEIWIYVDDGLGNLDLIEFKVPFAVSAATWVLKPGWNMISSKISTVINISTMNPDDMLVTLEMSVVTTLPSGGMWVLDN